MTDLLGGAVIRSGEHPAVIADAIVRLRSGRLVAIPTETVYGLAAPTRNQASIERIYEFKGRPADNPLIAHAASVSMARTLVDAWPEEADRLADACWPGPLTLVLPRAHDVPAVATGGRDSIAVRIPAHHVALSLISRFGSPLSAPSANRSGSLSPTEARHVLSEFVDRDLVVLDGGPCRLGLESTVVDLRPVLEKGVPKVLRPGAITPTRIGEILECPVQADSIVGQADAPGTHFSHYAPETPMRRCGPAEAGGDRVAVISVGPVAAERMDAHYWRVDLPDDPMVAGSLLFAALHAADLANAVRIDVVGPPSTEPWRAVEDRLQRASAPRGRG